MGLWHPARLTALTLLLFVFAVMPTTAYLGPRPSLDELITQANAVFFGEVVDVRASWETHARGRAIVTRATLRVLQRFKGSLAGYTELEFLGGTIGEVTLRVSDVPQFRHGDRDILFVNTAERSISPLVGVAHGRFRVVRDAARGVDVVRTHSGAPIRGIAALSPLGAVPLIVNPELSVQQFADEISRRIAAAERRQ